METRISFSGTGLVLAAFMILAFPIKWILAAIFAALVHEWCHCIMIKLTGNTILEIKLTQRGLLMKTTPMSHWQEFVCTLAGPAGSLLLFFCSRWIPRTSVCAGVQGLFNMLPVYPLDGGRAIRALSHILFSASAAERFCRWAMYGTYGFILFSGLFCSACLQMGVWPLLISLLVLSRALSEKYLAKREN